MIDLSPVQATDRITKLLDLKVPEGFLGKLQLLPRLLEVSKFPPRMASGTPSCWSSVTATRSR